MQDKSFISSLSDGDITERATRSDIAIFDVDECMLPGYTQIELGRALLRQHRRRGNRPGDQPGPVRLAGWGILLYFIKWTPLRRDRRNLLLHRMYIRALRGCHRESLALPVQEVWRSLCPGVRDCAGWLAGRRSLGIISLGLDFIMHTLPAALGQDGKPLPLEFLCCNQTTWRHDRLDGLREPVRHGPAGKVAMFLEATAGRPAAVPLVVGHNSDESGLCRLAEERGGLSIGLGVAADCREQFQVRFARQDWPALEQFFRRRFA